MQKPGSGASHTAYKKIQKAINDGCDTFITGMAPGVDTWAAQEVLKLKAGHDEIKLICAVPFTARKKRTVLLIS